MTAPRAGRAPSVREASASRLDGADQGAEEMIIVATNKIKKTTTPKAEYSRGWHNAIARQIMLVEIGVLTTRARELGANDLEKPIDLCRKAIHALDCASSQRQVDTTLASVRVDLDGFSESLEEQNEAEQKRAGRLVEKELRALHNSTRGPNKTATALREREDARRRELCLGRSPDKAVS